MKASFQILTQPWIPVKELDGSMKELSLLETLECYLLDARMHVTLTAEKMFLHKNTIKYRLQRIADHLGFVPGELPESMPLFTACALDRLLRGN